MYWSHNYNHKPAAVKLAMYSYIFLHKASIVWHMYGFGELSKLHNITYQLAIFSSTIHVNVEQLTRHVLPNFLILLY